jgi:hypothetical protein
MTTQEFVASDAWRQLDEVGIVLVDGYHTEAQARLDHNAFAATAGTRDGCVLFHDSVRERVSRIYGADKAYSHTVKRYMDALRVDPAWQVHRPALRRRADHGSPRGRCRVKAAVRGLWAVTSYLQPDALPQAPGQLPALSRRTGRSHWR